MHKRTPDRHKHALGHHFLARRGETLRTFGGFALVSSTISLVLGIYLVADTLRHPFGDPTGPLLSGAFFLAGGIVPLACLLNVALKRDAARWAEKIKLSALAKFEKNPETPVSPPKANPQLPFQRFYVDPTRVRP